jgi:biotin operon repressor
MRRAKQDKFTLAAQTALLTAGPGGARLSVTALARELGFSREAVSGAINRGLHSGVRAAVARRLGLSHA